MKILIGFMIFAITATSHAALIGRAPATQGGTDYQAYYDDVVGVTWLADANYAQTSGFDADGEMTWWAAVAFANFLGTNQHLGVSGWRLPDMTDIGNDGCLDPLNFNGGDCGYNIDTSTGEMASMFYDTLGNIAFFDTSGNGNQPGFGLQNTGPFTGLLSSLYWYQDEVVTDTSAAWYFGMPSGAQRTNGKTELYRAWVVVDGDALAAVPVPAAVWLFGSALGLLGWLRRGR